MRNNIQRDTKREGWEQHLTPRRVARYMRSEGKDVGRGYLTHGAIWDAKDDLKIGLLHLILDAAEEKKKQSDALDAHREWLICHHSDTLKLCLDYKEQALRIRCTLCGEHTRTVATKSQDLYMWRYSDIHDFAWLWCNQREEFYIKRDELISIFERLQSVKTPEDLIKLRGIGKRTVAKVIKSIELLEQKSKRICDNLLGKEHDYASGSK